jgi:3-oxoacyl-[acyl-carrier protein] reductase
LILKTDNNVPPKSSTPSFHLKTENVKPKTFLVTGTRKGIGRELAEYYLAKGHQVAGCSRGPSSIDHPAYRHWELDVADERAVVKMVKEVAREWGGIDVLINNAGIASMNHFALTPLATAQAIFGTNVFGSFLFCREAIKVMVRRKRGRIVNFTTVATPLYLEGEAMYAASKAAVENMTRVLAREVGDSGITVNAVGPTPVPTDLIKNVPKEKMDALLQRQAIRRFGSFEDVVNVVDFFVSERSDFVTGQVVYLGGVA